MVISAPNSRKYKFLGHEEILLIKPKPCVQFSCAVVKFTAFEWAFCMKNFIKRNCLKIFRIFWLATSLLAQGLYADEIPEEVVRGAVAFYREKLAHGEEVTVDHSNWGSRRLVLVSANQRRLFEIMFGMTQIFGTSIRTVLRRIVDIGDDEKVLLFDVTSLLSENFRDKIAGGLSEDGPNCFNAALIVAGLLSSNNFRLTLQGVFITRLTASYIMLEPGAPLDAGYILVWSDWHGQPQHAGVYLGGGFFFDKGSMYAESFFSLREVSKASEMFPIFQAWRKRT